VLIERLLDEPVVEVMPRLAVAIGLLEESEIDEYVAFRPEADPAEICRRREAGQVCFVVRHEGRIAHACWAAMRQARIDYLARDIHLAPDEVYVYDSFTAPAFRGQNLSPTRAVQMARHFREKGHRRLIAVIMPENKRAFRPAAKAGYCPLGVMGYIKLGPWRRDFCRVRPGARPPGQPLDGHGAGYWDNVACQMGTKPHYLDSFLGEMKRRAHLALIERWGGVPTAGWVLKTDLFEEAMGSDAFLSDLCGDNGRVVGIDVSPAIVARARRRDPRGQARYVAADVRHLPFASDAFALIVSPSTLDHFAEAADLGRSLRELARVMASGGRLIVTLDNRQNVFDPLLRLAIWLRRVPYYIGQSCTVGELTGELEAAGLTVQDTTAILHNPRLVATAAVALANRLRWSPLTALVRRALTAAQRLECTRWRYHSGCFVAALAARDVPPGGGNGWLAP